MNEKKMFIRHKRPAKDIISNYIKYTVGSQGVVQLGGQPRLVSLYYTLKSSLVLKIKDTWLIFATFILQSLYFQFLFSKRWLMNKL